MTAYDLNQHETFDLAVIGAGPAGHFGAIQAAKLGARVLVADMLATPGGAAAITGTIPSKTLREAAVHLTGLRQRAFYGLHYRTKDDLRIEDLTKCTDQIIQSETSVLEDQLRRNGVRFVRGMASFVSPSTIEVNTGTGAPRFEVDKVLIGVGSRPARPESVTFDGEVVFDSNQILTIDRIPQRLTVVGAGVIGIEYACIFAALGTRVTVIDNRGEFLEFVDRQIMDALRHHMQQQGVEFRLGETVSSIERCGDVVVAHTESNKRIVGDALLYSVGRQGNTDTLRLENAGLEADHRGRLRVNESYQTDVEHIYAAGDVIGFPALAATSREQGRSAVLHALGGDSIAFDGEAAVPYGIYSIPEISMIGPTEQELTSQGIPYEIGVAYYREIARGQILGDVDGMLKLIFDPDTRKVLGVHIVGEGATELIHIGQAARTFDAPLEYFADAVFNYPTLAECYKVAALDGLNRLAMMSRCDVSEDEVLRRAA